MKQPLLLGSALMALAALPVASRSYAEGGNSDFWFLGASGNSPATSLTETSVAAIYYLSSAKTHANKDFILGGVLDASINEFLGPVFRLETPILSSIGRLGLAGYSNGQIGATLTGALGQTTSGSPSIEYCQVVSLASSTPNAKAIGGRAAIIFGKQSR